MPAESTRIPFFATTRTDGTPDFKVINEKNRLRCANENLCWICGLPLEYWIIFIGGPKAIEQRLFVDGPMHPECAEISIKECPFLRGDKDYAEVIDLSKHEEGVEVHERVSKVAPLRVAKYLTRGFDIVTARGREWFFRAKPAKKIEWITRGD